MIRVFLLLLACMAGTWYLADAIKQKGPGYVYIYYNDYSVETSFWFALLLTIGLVVGVYVLTRLFALLFYYLVRVGYLPRFFWMGRARKLKYQGTLAFLNQQWRMAGKKLAKAGKYSETPFLDYAMAARACLAANDLPAAQINAALAKKAVDFEAGTHALLELDIALAQGDLQQQQNVQRMLQEQGNKPEVISRAIMLYRQQGQWPALQQLLPAIKKYRVLAAAEYSQLLADMAVGLMPGFASAAQRQDLKKLWKSVARVHDHEKVIQAYCAALLRMNETAEAQKILELNLKRQWSDSLIEQYGFVSGEDKIRQLDFAESFLPRHGDSPALLTALGAIAKSNGYLAKARDYLLRSLQIKPGVKACELLADIAGIQQDQAQVQHYLRQALALAVRP